MTGAPSYPESDGLVKAVRDIIEANNDFREGMPADWGGDPLQDAIDAAAKLLLGVAQERMGHDEIAKRIAFAHLGDDREWKGFRSHADRFLAYALPSTDREAGK